MANVLKLKDKKNKQKLLLSLETTKQKVTTKYRKVALEVDALATTLCELEQELTDLTKYINSLNQMED